MGRGLTLTDIERDAKEFIKGNKQMTRAEAINKLNSIDDSEENHILLKKLEALGLIKFEEEVKVPELHYVLKSLNIRDGIIGDLFSKGYEIRKIGVYDHG